MLCFLFLVARLEFYQCHRNHVSTIHCTRKTPNHNSCCRTITITAYSSHPMNILAEPTHTSSRVLIISTTLAQKPVSWYGIRRSCEQCQLTVAHNSSANSSQSWICCINFVLTYLLTDVLMSGTIEVLYLKGVDSGTVPAIPGQLATLHTRRPHTLHLTLIQTSGPIFKTS